jgi:predicted ATPase
MFTRIYADNYLCFVNFEFKPGPLNLLVGDNGSGKSALFRLLSGLRQLVRGLPVVESFPQDSLTRWETRTTQRFEVEIQAPRGRVYSQVIEIEHDRTTEKSRLLREEISLDGAPLASFVAGELRLQGRPEPVALPYEMGGSLLSLRLKNERLEELRVLWSAVGLFKLIPEQLGTSSSSEDGWLAGNGSNFAAWYRSMVQAEPAVAEGARDALREVIGGLRYFSFRGESGRKEMLAHFEPSRGARTPEYILKLSELSDGQRVLIFLYSVLAGFSVLPVLFFDEPDNFVSLREIQPWLMRLSEEVAKGGQAFLISHNPEVIDYLAADRVYLLERPGDGPARIKELLFDLEGGLRASEQLARGWTGGA